MFLLVEFLWVGIATGLSLLIWFFVFLKRKQDPLESKINNRFAEKKILHLDKTVTFKGHESEGYSQIQGGGYLVLTDEELYFEMTMMEKIVSIPVSSILKVDQSRRLKGVGTIRPMLIVEFADSNGEKDSIAVFVRNLPLWIKHINDVIN